MLRRVTATRTPSGVTLTMAPVDCPPYDVERSLWDGGALRTLKYWKVAKPGAVLEECVKTGSGRAMC